MFSALAFAVLLAVLHITALDRSWYWMYRWFDLVTHFLGGLVIGLMGLYTLLLYQPLTSRNEDQTLRQLVGFALLVGIVWEVFEYINDIATEVHYALDTTADLSMAVVATFVAVKAVYRIHDAKISTRQNKSEIL